MPQWKYMLIHFSKTQVLPIVRDIVNHLFCSLKLSFSFSGQDDVGCGQFEVCFHINLLKVGNFLCAQLKPELKVCGLYTHDS